MKWFKHFSDASDDEFLESVLDEFGLEGYARWWLLIEAIAAQMDSSSKCHVEYSWTKWQTILKGKRKKLETFLEHCEDESKIKTELNENKLRIECPNLLKLRDNYTKNLQADDKVSDKHTGKQEVDGDVEVDEYTDSQQSLIEPAQQQPKIPPCPYTKMVEAYHEGCPELARVKLVTDSRRKAMKTIWSMSPKHQDIGFWVRYFNHCGTLRFLHGRNDRGWKADFDFLIKGKSLAGVIEGKYKNEETKDAPR